MNNFFIFLNSIIIINLVNISIQNPTNRIHVLIDDEFIIIEQTRERVIENKCHKNFFNKCSTDRDCCSRICVKSGIETSGVCVHKISPTTAATKRIPESGYTRETATKTPTTKTRTPPPPPPPTTPAATAVDDEIEATTTRSYAKTPIQKKESVQLQRQPPPIRTLTYDQTGVDIPATVPSTIQDDRCGLRYNYDSGKVVGGRNAAKGQFPWMASLQKERNGTFTHACGGVVINESYILSAAHCFYKRKDQKILAKINFIDLKENNSLNSFEVDNIILHPNFKYEKNYDNDIALLHLQRPINRSDYWPICLPMNVHLSGEVEIAGWGKVEEKGELPTKLQSARVDLVNQRFCRNRYGKDIITGNMICASATNRDACSGDSGGPLMKEIENRAFVFGLVSFGIGCARTGNYGIYTKVAKYIDWIKEATIV